MAIAQDSEVILMALKKEREELHDRLMQIDRIIKRVKEYDYSGDKVESYKQITEDTEHVQLPAKLSQTSNVKIILLRIFDIKLVASPLADIQAEYTNITGKRLNIRESMRNLNNVGLLKRVRTRDSSRSFLWIKSEWLENGQLGDKYKPEGFDMLYSPDNLIFD